MGVVKGGVARGSAHPSPPCPSDAPCGACPLSVSPRGGKGGGKRRAPPRPYGDLCIIGASGFRGRRRTLPHPAPPTRPAARALFQFPPEGERGRETPRPTPALRRPLHNRRFRLPWTSAHPSPPCPSDAPCGACPLSVSPRGGKGGGKRRAPPLPYGDLCIIGASGFRGRRRTPRHPAPPARLAARALFQFPPEGERGEGGGLGAPALSQSSPDGEGRRGGRPRGTPLREGIDSLSSQTKCNTRLGCCHGIPTALD